MRKKRTFSDVSFERFSTRLSLALAAFLPLIAVALTHYLSAPSKSLKDSGNDISQAHQRLIDFCSENVKKNRSFVIFEHGTCVVVEDKTDTATIQQEAIQILRSTASPDARFVCTPVENDDLIVSYTEPVFHLRFKEDMSRHRAEIESDFRRFLTNDELADISPHWDPPFHAKVGLRSRARLLKDAAELEVAQIVAPRGTEKTSLGETASVSF